MEVKDLYREHEYHDTYEKQCSSCYSENRLIKAKRTVDVPLTAEETYKFIMKINSIIYGLKQ